MSLLTIEGLTIHAFGRTIFDDFALRVGPGEVVLLVGPNGSGKSTLLDVVAGVRPPLRGRITIAGADRAKAPTRAAAALGYAADRPDLPRDVRVDEWLSLVAGVRGVPALRSAELPFSVGELRGQPLGALSLGETRRVLLAAAWTGAPPLLLLDEPTNGLDVARREELERRITEHAGSPGRAVLVATHDRRWIARARERGWTLVSLATRGEGAEAGRPKTGAGPVGTVP